MLPFLKIMLRNLLLGPSTDPFPFAPAQTPEKFRGCVEFDPQKCILCGICRHVCAPGAIQLRASEDGSGMHYVLWHNSCVFCGMCAHYCPTGALKMSTNWHLSHLGEEKFSYCITSFIPFGECTMCGAKIQPRPQVIIDKLGARHPDRFLLCPQCKCASTVKHVAKILHVTTREKQ
jgi:formate hydrogenlyase subunit 6/NADH:ubiquinone oxidoreductase subunit I